MEGLFVSKSVFTVPFQIMDTVLSKVKGDIVFSMIPGAPYATVPYPIADIA